VYDTFIAKLNGDCDVQWAKSVGGSSNEFISAIDMDAGNRIFAASYFYSPQIIVEDITIINSGSPDTFTAMFNADGDVHWAFGLDGAGSTSEIPRELAVSDAGQCLVSGVFGSSIEIGSFSFVNSGGDDAFLTLLDQNGAVQWTQALLTPSYESTSDLEFTDEQHFYCAGQFESPTLTIGDETLTNAGSAGYDVFLAYFQINGATD